MKNTYKIIMEKINGQSREVVVVLKKSMIKKLPDGYAHGVHKEPNVRLKSKKKPIV